MYSNQQDNQSKRPLQNLNKFFDEKINQHLKELHFELHQLQINEEPSKKEEFTKEIASFPPVYFDLDLIEEISLLGKKLQKNKNPNEKEERKCKERAETSGRFFITNKESAEHQDFLEEKKRDIKNNKMVFNQKDNKLMKIIEKKTKNGEKIDLEDLNLEEEEVNEDKKIKQSK